MVEQIPATVTDPTLCDTVLPRTSETGPLWLDVEGLHGIDHLRIEAGTAIKDQVHSSCCTASDAAAGSQLLPDESVNKYSKKHHRKCRCTLAQRGGCCDENQLPSGGCLRDCLLAARRTLVRPVVQQAVDGARTHERGTSEFNESGLDLAVHPHISLESLDRVCPRAGLHLAQREHRLARRRGRRHLVARNCRPDCL